METNKNTGHVVAINLLPDRYPTNLHESEFWECLGRAVATFGFLENVLARAIFSFTAIRSYNEEEIEQAYNEWLPKLENALKDPLGSLVDSYGKAVRDNPEATIMDLNELLSDLREASKVRNVICHGFWSIPDENKASVPFFVNRKMEIFEMPIDIKFLNNLQTHTTDLACSVINTVTHMGWQFPGGSGPGNIIWKSD